MYASDMMKTPKLNKPRRIRIYVTDVPEDAWQLVRDAAIAEGIIGTDTAVVRWMVTQYARIIEATPSATAAAKRSKR